MRTTWISGLVVLALIVGVGGSCRRPAPRRAEGHAGGIDGLALVPTPGASLPRGAVRRIGTPGITLPDALWGMGRSGNDRFYMVYGGGGNVARARFSLYDRSAGRLLRSFGVHRQGWRVSADGRCLLFSASNRYNERYPVRAFDLVRDRFLPDPVQPSSDLHGLYGVALSDRCARMTVWTGSTKLVAWNLQSGTLIREISDSIDATAFTSATLAGEGRLLFLAGDTNRAFFVDAGIELTAPEGDELEHVTVSDPGNVALAKFRRSSPALHRLTDGARIAAPWLLNRTHGWLTSSGSHAITSDGSTLEVVDLRSGRRVASQRIEGVSRLDLLLGDTRAAVFTPNLLRVLDLPSLRERFRTWILSEFMVRKVGDGELYEHGSGNRSGFIDMRVGARPNWKLPDTGGPEFVTAVLGNRVIVQGLMGWGSLHEYQLSPRVRGLQDGQVISVPVLTHLAFSPDGTALVALRSGASAFRYRLAPVRDMGSFPEPLGRTLLKTDGSGHHLLSREGETNRVHEIQEGGGLRPLEGFAPVLDTAGEHPVCAVSPSRESLACLGDAGIHLIQRPRRAVKQVATLPRDGETEPDNRPKTLVWWRDQYLLSRESMEYRIQDRLSLYDVESGKARALWSRKPREEMECGPVVGPTGQFAAGGRGEVRMWRGPHDTQPAVFTGLPDRCDALGFRADGTLLALFKSVYERPVVLALKPGQKPARVLELDVPDADVLPAAFSPGGRYLATTTQGSAILLWRLH